MTNMSDRVDALGGSVEVRSEPGAGTCVRGEMRTHTRVRPRQSDLYLGRHTKHGERTCEISVAHPSVQLTHLKAERRASCQPGWFVRSTAREKSPALFNRQHSRRSGRGDVDVLRWAHRTGQG